MLDNSICNVLMNKEPSQLYYVSILDVLDGLQQTP